MSEAGRVGTVGGIVPAAGASRRMGRPKALLEIGGRTFVARSVHALVEGGCDAVRVVVRSDDRDTAALARRAGASVVRNADPGDGPITSLRLALAPMRDVLSGIVVLPLDHALVEARHVHDLLARARASDAPIVLPVRRGKRGHPSFFRHTLFDELLDPALEGGARTVVHRHLDDAHTFDCDDVAVVTDVDTPADLAEAVRLHARRREELGTS